MATAKTKDQWYEILKGWVPSWFFEAETNNKAHFYALASLLSTIEQDALDHISETQILQAEGRFLDQHGDDRNKIRRDGELDPPFAERIRLIFNKSNKPALQDIATNLNGPLAYVQEWFDDGIFLNTNAYLNIGQLFLPQNYNEFYVFIDRIENIIRNGDFINVDAFFNAGTFIVDDEGDFDSVTDEEGDANFDSIFAAIDEARAAGVHWVLVEREDFTED